jgi:predicted negative regulator of RcsB-dependent stress response
LAAIAAMITVLVGMVGWSAWNQWVAAVFRRASRAFPNRAEVHPIRTVVW